MEINAKHANMVFAAEFGDEQINMAVNFMQKAYEDFMKPAWDKLAIATTDEEKAAAGQDVAQRGMGFVVATGAFHMMLSAKAPKEIEDILADIIANVTEQMSQQLEARRQADKVPAAKA